MSTHNICFQGVIRKILCGYPHLSGTVVLNISGKYSIIEYKGRVL